MDLRDYLEIVIKRKKTILFVSLCVIAGYSIFFFTQTPTYTARSRVLLRLPPEWQDMPVISMPSWETRVALASSQPVLERTKERLAEQGLDVSTGKIAGGLSVRPETKTDFVDLHYTSKNAENAKKILQALTEVFLEYDQENNQKSLSNAARILKNEMERTKEKIVTQEARAEKLDQLHAVTNTILESKKRLNSLKEKYGPSYPRRKVVQQRLDDARTELRVTYQRLFPEEYDPDGTLDEHMVEETDVRRANEELERAKNRYDQLRRNMDQVRFNRSLLGQSGNIIAHPESVSISYPTNYKTYGFVALAGILLGISTGALLEFLDDRIVTKFDIHRYLGLKVLGKIPRVEPDEINLIETPQKTPLSEQYHSISALLEYSLLSGTTGKSIQITSTADDEGKTITAVNLSASLAREGEKVLLIDLDMREPELHQIFGLMNSEGVSSILTGSLELEHAIQDPRGESELSWDFVEPLIESTPESGLDVLPCGPIPSNPIKTLKSNYLTNLLSLAENHYGVTIIDSPPIQAVVDPVILSTKADGVLMVIQSEFTRRGEAQHSKHLLDDVDANILGTILNGINRQIPEYYEYYSEQ